MLEVRLLGQFHVQLDGEIVQIPSRPVQSLFAYLVLSAGTEHRREKLAGLFWADATEANARSYLRHALWRLRKSLETGSHSGIQFILSNDLTVAFDAQSDYWLDAAILDRKFEAETVSFEELFDSVSAYRGELLPGFYEEWVILERTRLRTAFQQKVGLLLERLLEGSRWREILEWGERWIALGESPEQAYRALMVAHYALGDLSSMAGVYQRCIKGLREELGVEPSIQTQDLYKRLSKGKISIAKTQDYLAGLISQAELEAPFPGEPPYKGLQFFDQDDAGIFFGREKLTAQLVVRLSPLLDERGQGEMQPFLAVIGASGSGKSSLVRAGLVPALKGERSLEDGTLAVAASHAWPVHVITPTAHPLEALALSLTLDDQSVRATTTLMDELVYDARSLHLYVSKMLKREENDAKPAATVPSTGGTVERRLLLVVDQFEELFTLCQEEAERQAFIDNLMTAVEMRTALVLVIALRADFYAHCGRYDRLRFALENGQVYIGPMDKQELHRAISEPARQGGWVFEAGLVDTLVQEAGDEPGSLPLLSHALLESWQRRRGQLLTFDGYRTSGGIRGAIAQTAERVLQRMNPDQREITRNIFIRLTELGEGTQDTRRRVERLELVLKTEEADQVEEVLRRLAEARLITLSEQEAEVAHEALIREWPTLLEWLQQNREGLRIHRDLTERSKAWSRLDQDPGELYRGARLAQANEWAEAHAADLNPLEREFLESSRQFSQSREAEREAQRLRELQAAQKLAEAEQQRAEVQERANTRLRWLAGGLGLLLLVVLLLAALAIRQTSRAQQLARLATARELAAASVSNLELDPELSVMLALRAVEETYARDQTVLTEAANALHRAVQVSRIQNTLSAHDDQVWGLAYSPDGSLLATASVDGSGKIWDLAERQVLQVLNGEAGIADDVTFSPDGTRLAISYSEGVTKVWDVVTGQELLTLPGESWATSVDFSPDGSLLAVGYFEGVAKLWDLQTGQVSLILSGYDVVIDDVDFSPNGERLVTASGDKTAKLWDLSTGDELVTFSGHSDQLYAATFSPDGKRVATSSTDSTARVWDSATGELLATLSGHTNEIIDAAFDPSGERVATASADGRVIIWDASSGRQLQKLTGHAGWVINVEFSPDGQTLASCSFDGTVKFWDWDSPGREALTLTGHTGRVTEIALSPDETRLVTTSTDESARVWDATSGRELFTLHGAGDPQPFIWTSEVYFSPDSRRLSTVSADGNAGVWDVTTGQELFELEGHDGRVWDVELSPDGTRLATAGEDGTARLWEADTGRESFVLSGHTGIITDVAFSPDGKLLSTASDDGTAKVWDVSTGRELHTLLGHTNWVQRLVFNPQGTRLITIGGDWDWSARVWDTASGQELFQLEGHTDKIWDAAFSPDGQLVATASVDGTAKVWRAETGELLFNLVGHASTVWRNIFSPDGALLVTASGDGTTKVWDIANGQELLTLAGHTNLVTALAFNREGTRLFTASDDGTARAYILPIEELMSVARARLTRSWTVEECQKFLHQSAEDCPAAP